MTQAPATPKISAGERTPISDQFAKTKKQRKIEANSYLSKALITSLATVPEDQLILSCGATHHMFNSTKFFLSLSTSTFIPVRTGNTNSSLKAVGVGKALSACDSKPEHKHDSQNTINQWYSQDTTKTWS
ncbi:hypothetical protein O181_079119 [Austropuccinia psidii MF-1]|uniref:Uncharacterized protein n=1 Tax=Austropuccinia psidii MF-1 TaxID=1389203 RepID=A0A9Q3FI95_9BASI|nr:hypothetical protein [Austropuccinia psidii MF-1]